MTITLRFTWEKKADEKECLDSHGLGKTEKEKSSVGDN